MPDVLSPQYILSTYTFYACGHTFWIKENIDDPIKNGCKQLKLFWYPTNIYSTFLWNLHHRHFSGVQYSVEKSWNKPCTCLVRIEARFPPIALHCVLAPSHVSFWSLMTLKHYRWKINSCVWYLKRALAYFLFWNWSVICATLVEFSSCQSNYKN